MELLRESYKKRCKVLGEENPDTLANLSNLAMTYENSGNYEKSLELHKEVYEKNCKILGEEHPDTLLAQATLLKLREKSKRGGCL